MDLEGSAQSAVCVTDRNLPSQPRIAGETCRARIQGIGTRYLPYRYVCLLLEHTRQRVTLNPSPSSLSGERPSRGCRSSLLLFLPS